MITITLFLVFVFGLLLGSFFNVLIWRLPRDESVMFPPSHCPSCGHQIRAWENIPVLSYVFLRGRCSSCKATISIQYPIIELLTACAAALFWYFISQTATLNSWWNYIPLMVKLLSLILIIPITIIDIRHYIIPDKITLPLLLLSIAISFIPGDTTPIQSGLGVLAGGGSLYLVGWLGTVLFKKGEAMGGGDIKMMAAMGALWGPQVALLSIVFGAFAGALCGVLLLMIRKLASDHKIPFGPYLGAGLWIAAPAGGTVLTLYLNFVENLVLR